MTRQEQSKRLLLADPLTGLSALVGSFYRDPQYQDFEAHWAVFLQSHCLFDYRVEFSTSETFAA
jgi:hypothetical protein